MSGWAGAVIKDINYLGSDSKTTIKRRKSSVTNEQTDQSAMQVNESKKCVQNVNKANTPKSRADVKTKRQKI